MPSTETEDSMTCSQKIKHTNSNMPSTASPAKRRKIEQKKILTGFTAEEFARYVPAERERM
jgi:hypothetical protein